MQHDFAEPGTHLVTLTVADPGGQSRIYTKTIDTAAHLAAEIADPAAKSSPAPVVALLGVTLLGAALLRRARKAL